MSEATASDAMATLDPSRESPQNIYKLLVGSVVPRPIAFVSSMDSEGVRNLAPFSFFTVASANPPVVCFCPMMRGAAANGLQPTKDTLRNIIATREFVVNIVSEDFAVQMNACSAELPPKVDEFMVSGLTPIASDLVRPPRVAESNIQMECRLQQMVHVSTEPLGGSLVLGEVLRFHVRQSLLDNFRIDPKSCMLLAAWRVQPILVPEIVLIWRGPSRDSIHAGLRISVFLYEGGMTTADANYPIQRVAVLGAGTMGSRIAAQIANAGYPVLLLDMASPEASARNHLASQSLDRLKKSKPAVFVDPALVSHVSVGNFEDDLEKLGDCDWVIEAVAENVTIKRTLLAGVAPWLRHNAIVTTNTSGLSVAQIAENLPEHFRHRWFGTHFFNPPRYMRLLEIIATPESDPAAVASVEHFAQVHLGKTVVHAHDTPNFIANRIGTFALLNTFRAMLEFGLTIEEVDLLTGSIIGWPKTGTFRLADMVGIDVLSDVIRNFAANSSEKRSETQLPVALEKMLERRWLGDKVGQGFYKKVRGADGKEMRLALDVGTLEYRAAQRPKMAALEMAKSNEAVAPRIRALLAGNPDRDKAARFYWKILPELWAYAADRIGEVADTVVDIDRAMKAGFNWELGPFEMWDAAGFLETIESMRARKQAIPDIAETMMAAGVTSWYRNQGDEFFDVVSRSYRPVVETPGLVTLAKIKRTNGVVKKNPGASLIDLGDGIACIEFHSKMNALGEDIVTFVRQTLRAGGDAVRNFQGFVVTSDAANFSVGANLMQVLLAIQDEEWDEIDRYVREFQAMTQVVRLCTRPVVVAPFGLCLGGGVELALHAAARRAHVELYMGLVETSVGLLPAGGGCKEMTLRAIDAARAVQIGSRSNSVEMNDSLRNVFETIAMAKVSTSAQEAQALRLLRESDGITMHRERVLVDAKLEAKRLADAGYVPPLPRTNIPAPGDGMLANLKLAIYMMREAEFISDHDAKIGCHVAHVLCGGAVTPGTHISEQYLLDLEREAFLSLCGEPKTKDRIASTLKTGKPLRN